MDGSFRCRPPIMPMSGPAGHASVFTRMRAWSAFCPRFLSAAWTCKSTQTENGTQSNLERKRMESVYILGGGRTDFKRNLKKEGKTIRHIIIEAGKKAIDDAKIDPEEIQAGAVGNLNGGQLTKQFKLGAFIRKMIPNWAAIPRCQPKAACASGRLPCLLVADGSL